MYNNRSPIIRSGQVAVLNSNDNSDAFKELGKVDGYNSKKGKLRRNQESGIKFNKDTNVDVSGMLLYQSDLIGKERGQVQSYMQDPKEHEKEDFVNSAQNRLYDFSAKAQQSNAVAKLAKETLATFGKKDPELLENWKPFKDLVEGKNIPEGTSIEDYNAMVQAAALQVKETFVHDYEIDPQKFGFKKIVNSDIEGNYKNTNESWVLTEASKVEAERKGKAMFLSGKKQSNPNGGDSAVFKRLEDITYYNDIMEYVHDNYGAEYNSATPEEKEQIELKSAAEFYQNKLLSSKSEEEKKEEFIPSPTGGSNRTKNKEGNKREEEINLATNIKSWINELQDSGDPISINSNLAPYGLKLTPSGGGFTIDQLSGKRDKHKVSQYAPKTGVLSLGDPTKFYEALAKLMPNITIEDFNNAEYNDPTPGKLDYTKDQYAKVQDLVTQLLEADKNEVEIENGIQDVAAQFGDDVTYIENTFGYDQIQIGKKKYHVINDAAEIAEILKEKGLKKMFGELKGKANNENEEKENDGTYEVGYTEGGYKYLGGDATDPKNWQEI